MSTVFSNRSIRWTTPKYLDCAGHCQPNAYEKLPANVRKGIEGGEVARTSVARRGLYDHTLSGNQLALRLCSLNHFLGDPILCGSTRRHVFDFPHCQTKE